MPRILHHICGSLTDPSVSAKKFYSIVPGGGEIMDGVGVGAAGFGFGSPFRFATDLSSGLGPPNFLG